MKTTNKDVNKLIDNLVKSGGSSLKEAVTLC